VPMRPGVAGMACLICLLSVHINDQNQVSYIIQYLGIATNVTHVEPFKSLDSDDGLFTHKSRVPDRSTPLQYCKPLFRVV
jgi:hypothetical protein